MALTIYLCGHGTWSPKDGYFNLPRGCSMSFVVNASKLLYTKDMYAVCEGSWPSPFSRTVRAYQSCPNMTWAVDEPAKRDICEDKLARNSKHAGTNPARVLFPRKTKTLKEFFAQSQNYIRMDLKRHDSIEFVWNCCSALGLRPTTRGGLIGVNAAEAVDTYDYVDLTGKRPRRVGTSRPK